MKKILLTSIIILFASYAQAASITLTMDNAKVSRVIAAFAKCDDQSFLTGADLIKHCIRKFVIQKVYSFEHNIAVITAATGVVSDNTLVDE